MDFWKTQCEPVWADHPDLLVLPEACGHAYQASLGEHLIVCESVDEALLCLFSELAATHRCWVALPTYRRDEAGEIRNSIRLLDRRGQVVGAYDKNYPTIDEVEAGVVPGDQSQVIETELGRVACVICFDLNFLDLCSEVARQQPDLILFCSMYHGGHVQSHWAHACRAHLISAVADLPSGVRLPTGEPLAMTTLAVPHVTTLVTPDCCLAHFNGNREKFRACKQMHGRKVTFHDPDHLGVVLMTSHDPTQKAQQVAESFGIELFDDYLARTRRVRCEALQGGN